MPGRNYIIIICVFLFPFRLLAQDITGLWKGTLHNDTTGKDLRYEIAISEKNGKLSGYSHTFFILDDQEYYGIKKVNVKTEGDKIIVQNTKLITHNYPIPPAKGVFQLDVLTLETRDGIMILSGPFTTNRTRVYHSLTGSINIQKKTDYSQSALIPHLEELGLAGDLSFVTKAIAVDSKPVPPIIPELPVEKPVVTASKPATIAKTIKKEKPKAIDKVTRPVTVKTEPVTAPEPVILPPAAEVKNRLIETVQSVYFKSDSLVLTLYDNGEVDGDTVSVLMNGEVIMPKVGLSTRAIRKTIYITKASPDSIQLIMYAENLGSIPPNTGLLVVHDGTDIYEIRFSGDLRKNAAIVFRKK